jgi:hypothetical protein
MLLPIPAAMRGTARNVLASPRGPMATPLPMSPTPRRQCRYSSTVVSTSPLEVCRTARV